MKTTNENFTAKALTLDEMRSVDGGCPTPIMHNLLMASMDFAVWLEKQGREFVDGFNDGTGNCN